MFRSVVNAAGRYSTAFPVFFSTRTRLPSTSRRDTLTGSLDFALTSIRFEMWIGDSRSTIPPFCSCWDGFWCFLTKFRPSTRTRCLSGSTRRILPVLPRALPEITLTVSFFLIFKATLHHLRRKRHDFHELAFAKLAGDRSENAGSLGLLGIVDDHHGVLTETNRRAVTALDFTNRAYHDRFLYTPALDGTCRGGVFHGNHDDIANRGITAACTTEH